MFCITPETDDPFINLAIEESLFKNSDKEYLILYINKPSIIIGKHQAVHREVNTKFVVENNVPVIRRISGGGTVYHDNGNLNFTFIRSCEPGRQVDFRRHTQPVIDFLISCGVRAEFEGKNGIKVDGLKISGNAEHVIRNRVLHHGTLLFDTSLEMLENALRKDKSCYESRAVESNPTPVINLKTLLKRFKDVIEFRSELMKFLMNNMPGMVKSELSKPEMNEAELLAKTKYMAWEWNYAYGPEYSFNNSFRINGELHSCKLSVREGVIRYCEIEGYEVMAEAGKKLTGCRHMVHDMLKVLHQEIIFFADEEIYVFFDRGFPKVNCDSMRIQ